MRFFTTITAPLRMGLFKLSISSDRGEGPRTSPRTSFSTRRTPQRRSARGAPEGGCLVITLTLHRASPRARTLDPARFHGGRMREGRGTSSDKKMPRWVEHAPRRPCGWCDSHVVCQLTTSVDQSARPVERQRRAIQELGGCHEIWIKLVNIFARSDAFCASKTRVREPAWGARARTPVTSGLSRSCNSLRRQKGTRNLPYHCRPRRRLRAPREDQTRPPARARDGDTSKVTPPPATAPGEPPEPPLATFTLPPRGRDIFRCLRGR